MSITGKPPVRVAPTETSVYLDRFIANYSAPESEGLKMRKAFAKLELAELEALHTMCADGLTRARLRVAAVDKGTPEALAAYDRMLRQRVSLTSVATGVHKPGEKP